MTMLIYIVGFCATSFVFGVVKGTNAGASAIAKGIVSAIFWPFFWCFLLFAAIGSLLRKDNK